MTHPSKDITGTSGTQLSGKKIALLVSSSVASFKVPEIARELMRHGADVYAVISPSTEKMIGSDLLEWATGNPVVRELTGKLEHIALAGKSSGHVDLVLIAPATANTIGKLASGIDDTPVTTVAATAIGSKLPVLIAPAMHEPLYDHPIAQENIARLKRTRRICRAGDRGGKGQDRINGQDCPGGYHTPLIAALFSEERP